MLAEFQIIVVCVNLKLVTVNRIHVMPKSICGIGRAVPPDNIIKPNTTLFIGPIEEYTAPFARIRCPGPTIGIIINNCIVD